MLRVNMLFFSLNCILGVPVLITDLLNSKLLTKCHRQVQARDCVIESMQISLFFEAGFS